MKVVQKLVLLIGCLVLLYRALYPPWIAIYHNNIERPIGHRPVSYSISMTETPALEIMGDKWAANDARVDAIQWASECLTIVAVMGILLALPGLIAALFREPKSKTGNT